MGHFEKEKVRMTEEQRKRYCESSSRWRKENAKQFTIQLNKVNDADIIEFLATKPNRHRYIINLIRKDMRR